MDARGKNNFSFSDMLFVVGITVVAVLIPVFVARIHFFSSLAGDRSPIQWIVAILVALLAVFFVGFNLYTSFFRPWMYRRTHGDYNGYQNVSGAPALGSILIAIAALFLPSSPWIGGVLLALYFIDPGGIHFFVFAMVRDYFTDEQKKHNKSEMATPRKPSD
jgi:O-antigen/teichoic acid export membrane protein